MTNEFKYLKEGVASDMIGYLIEDYHLSLREAMRVLYDSETFSKLCDPSTGLYFQGSRYVYSYLQDELQTGDLKSPGSYEDNMSECSDVSSMACEEIVDYHKSLQRMEEMNEIREDGFTPTSPSPRSASCSSP